MKNYQQYYQIIVKSAKAIRQKPSVWHYILVRFAENIPVCLLAALTGFLAALGLILAPKDPEGARWAMDAAKLCLVVLLASFAPRKRA